MTQTEQVEVARAFSRRPSDQNWAWLYMLLSGRLIGQALATTTQQGETSDGQG